jgi:hypothetical protein
VDNKVDQNGEIWLTPEVYLASVKKVLGPIWLDPFSTEEGNSKVEALHYFPLEEDAFEQDWCIPGHARSAFMNPQYGPDIEEHAVLRFVEEYEKGSFEVGIILIDNSTDANWFQTALRMVSAICFANHYMREQTVGQVFLYFGEGAERFRREFTQHGFVAVLPRRWSVVA